MITDSIGSSETGFGGTSIVAKGEHHMGGPRVKIDGRTVVLDDDGNEVKPGSGVRASSPRRATSPSATTGTRRRRPKPSARSTASAMPSPATTPGWEEDGTVTMLGRGSVSINSGGEKIYPEEVEAALKGHPDVFDALVVGVPDPRLRPARGGGGRAREGARPRWPSWTPVRAQRDRRIQSATQSLAGRRGQTFAGGQARLPLGQEQTEERPADFIHQKHGDKKHVGSQRLMRTQLCDRFGIQYPIFVFHRRRRLRQR